VARHRVGKKEFAIEELLGDGTWTEVPVRREGDHIVIPRQLNVYDTLVLRMK